MGLLDNIIDIQISKSTLGVNSADFGTLLIIGNSIGNQRVKSYSTIQEVSEDFEDNMPEFKAANLAFNQETKPKKILIGQILIDEDSEDPQILKKTYIDIKQKMNNFYAVMITSKKESDQLVMASIVENEKKIFGLSTNDSAILDSEDEENILHFLNIDNRQRSFVIYNSFSGEDYPEAAWFGLMLTKKAGTSTWAFKNLNGVIADNLSMSEMNILDDKNANYTCSLGGRDIMCNGIMANGEYIDIIRGLDWIKNDMQTSIANALIQSEKIPFTNQGITIIESIIRNSLNKAAAYNIIDLDSITIDIPDIRSISAEFKQRRILPDVKFKARLSGAIHKLDIQGIVTI